MDQIINGVIREQNVALTVLQGLQRSRFLLRSELYLLAPGPDRSIKRVYHVVDSDRLLEKVYAQAVQMPFRELGVHVSKGCEGFECTPSSDKEYVLFVCTLKCILVKYSRPNNSIAPAEPREDLIVFDGITIENLEGSLCEAIQADADNSTDLKLPSVTFNKIRGRCYVLACNMPLDGVEAELGTDFDVVITDSHPGIGSYRVTSQLLPRDQSGKPFKFGGLDYVGDSDVHNKQRLHEQTGKVLESLARQNEPGGIVIFFPSYGQMVEYHNAWKQLGTLDRLGMPYGRENRGGNHFKNSLLQFLNEERFTFLCSIRYHKEEDLAEFVMAHARAIMVIGLPYPFMNDTWDARIKYENEDRKYSSRLCGQDLHMFTAIEFLNGVLKRCLNEYRHRDVSVILLDEALESHRDKLAIELGDVPVINLTTVEE